jgi:hypothetical protein
MYNQIFFLSHSVAMLEQERKWRLLEQYGAIPSCKNPYWKSLRKKIGKLLVQVGQNLQKDIIVHSKTAC